MQHPIRYTSLVPTQLDRLAAATTDPGVLAALRSFQAILVGGQLPNRSSMEHLKSLGVNVVESYGMAETCGGCVYDGVPLEGVELEIVDGKVVVSGPVLANGLGQAFATQDLAEIVDGKLKVLGRSDRVIISGGKKVSLDDVEQRVLQLDSVRQAMAVAVASKWGQSAALLITGPKPLELAELNAVLEGPAKAIAFRQLDELPRLESGKPDYQAAKQLLAD
jgi:O-succinylbenzoic acid--CoA ligase